MKKAIVIIAIVLGILGIGTLGGYWYIESIYTTAVEDWNNGNYVDASKGFDAVLFYKDSKIYFNEFENKLAVSLSRDIWTTGEKYNTITSNSVLCYDMYFHEDFSGGEQSTFSSPYSKGDGLELSDLTYGFSWDDGKLYLNIVYDTKFERSGIVYFDHNDPMQISMFRLEHNEEMFYRPSKDVY